MPSRSRLESVRLLLDRYFCNSSRCSVSQYCRRALPGPVGGDGEDEKRREDIVGEVGKSASMACKGIEGLPAVRLANVKPVSAICGRAAFSIASGFG